MTFIWAWLRNFMLFIRSTGLKNPIGVCVFLSVTVNDTFSLHERLLCSSGCTVFVLTHLSGPLTARGFEKLQPETNDQVNQGHFQYLFQFVCSIFWFELVKHFIFSSTICSVKRRDLTQICSLNSSTCSE